MEPLSHLPLRTIAVLPPRHAPNGLLQRRPSGRSPRRRYVRWLAAGLVILALLIASLGCRGAAYQEAYQQKLFGEIRNLEDQLYEADYRNQVLLDELARTRSQVKLDDAQPVSPRREPPRRRPSTQDQDEPSETPPTLPARPLEPDDSYEPPSISLPPSADDLEIPDVDLGEPVPPADREATPELPPGRVEVPESALPQPAELLPAPVGVRIDAALSGGYRFDDAEDRTGMQLAIQAIDGDGRPVPLSDFDVAASLSIVLLDPQRDADEARIGRWDYQPEELPELLSDAPGGGWHLYLPWRQKPLGDTVIAHVRLAGDDVELRAEAELSTVEPSLAGWNPRGSSLRR